MCSRRCSALLQQCLGFASLDGRTSNLGQLPPVNASAGDLFPVRPHLGGDFQYFIK
jgi:hypothetical protein